MICNDGGSRDKVINDGYGGGHCVNLKEGHGDRCCDQCRACNFVFTTLGCQAYWQHNHLQNMMMIMWYIVILCNMKVSRLGILCPKIFITYFNISSTYKGNGNHIKYQVGKAFQQANNKPIKSTRWRRILAANIPEAGNL